MRRAVTTVSARSAPSSASVPLLIVALAIVGGLAALARRSR